MSVLKSCTCPKAPSLNITNIKSRPTHPAVGGDIPRIAADRLERVKDALGIPLLFDGQQPVVVAAEELLLPVEDVEVGLVDVVAGARRGGLDGRDDVLGHGLLVGDHLGPVLGGVAPGRRVLHVDGGVAPVRVHGVVDAGGGRGVEGDAGGEDAVLVGAVADGRDVGGAGGVVGQHVARDEAGAEVVGLDLDVAVGQGAHPLVVVVAVAGVAGGARRVGDGEVGEDVEEGLEDGLCLVGRLVVRRQRVDGEDVAAVEEDDHGALVCHAGKEGVESVEHLPPLLLRGVGRCRLQADAANAGVGVGADGDGGDDAKGPRAAAAEGPEEVRVLGARGGDDLSVCGDDLELESLVGGHAEVGSEGRVAATLYVTAGGADSGALAADDDEAGRFAGLGDLVAEDAGAHFQGGAVPEVVGPVYHGDVLKLVGPGGEGSRAGRSAEMTGTEWVSMCALWRSMRGGDGRGKEEMVGLLVTRVPDEETDVVVSSKVDGLNDILGGCHLDGVVDVVAK
ncbi:hypothetical protein CTA2_12604 [Colletotrichum tanaceti]|uniref:Uncharacterized protein n=1 Tax=Colletotrichum tanaceti TaxID=1306861 RepID=A0A4U6XQA2_9PEZI|nr:hypothetical protein CTA2_12604 [Colletotrichum tanaceti]TKW58005.1 hypothetical protein CTA1_792 [Colletotrichum tanaceti]